MTDPNMTCESENNTNESEADCEAEECWEMRLRERNNSVVVEQCDMSYGPNGIVPVNTMLLNDSLKSRLPSCVGGMSMVIGQNTATISNG